MEALSVAEIQGVYDLTRGWSVKERTDPHILQAFMSGYEAWCSRTDHPTTSSLSSFVAGWWSAQMDAQSGGVGPGKRVDPANAQAAYLQWVALGLGDETMGRARLDALREQLLRATLEDLLTMTPHLDIDASDVMLHAKLVQTPYVRSMAIRVLREFGRCQCGKITSEMATERCTRCHTPLKKV